MNHIGKKKISEIQGDFIIPSYQRGYRWKDEVRILLDDIGNYFQDGNSNKEYCLQPIVVKNLENGQYELIDGQQRLTTTFLIMSYLKLSMKIPLGLKYSINYKIREKSKIFLDNIEEKCQEQVKNIDEYFLKEAFLTIREWFSKQVNPPMFAWNFCNNFTEKTFFIWYEVSTQKSAEELFTRLNIGKIPLTNAELIKALFLSINNGIDENKQKEIAMKWDNMERELHNENFWNFFTNENADKYPTRIELIFDLIENHVKKSDDDRTTFYRFKDKKSEKIKLWQDIERYFQRIKEWYEDFDMYHKIGYLICSDGVKMNHLLQEAEGKTKSEFKNLLDAKIANTINTAKEYSDIEYGKDSLLIQRILLLFNVETMRQHDDKSSRFPFEKHKQNFWTLEHIHAKNSQGLNTNAAKVEWLKRHIDALNSIDNSSDSGEDKHVLIAEAKELQKKLDIKNNSYNLADSFENIRSKIVTMLSCGNNYDEENLDSLSNMALLSFPDNSALNNSVFDVKRRKIIEKDKNNEYIPVCTKHCFLKYYTNKDIQLHFWDEEDRNDYLKAMQQTLSIYLKINGKNIVDTEEGENEK